MENEIPNKYIDDIINEIERSIGVTEPINGNNIFSFVRAGKKKDALKLIAFQLNLPINIYTTEVPDNYQVQNNSNTFKTRSLSKIRRQGGSDGITAQVHIPGNLPRFGSSMMNGFPVNIKICQKLTKNPVVFTLVIAHELSHILLYSLNHPHKENEFYTDIAAIMSGFLYVFRDGRVITKIDDLIFTDTVRTTTSTYGYLNDSQFDFAFKKINLLLQNKRREKVDLEIILSKNLKLLKACEKIIFQFQKFLKYSWQNPSQKISENNGVRISTFFQSGYIDNLVLQMKGYRDKRLIIQNFLKELFCYTRQNSKQLLVYSDTIKKDSIEMQSLNVSLKNDLKLLKMYASYGYKLKVIRSLLFKNNFMDIYKDEFLL